MTDPRQVLKAVEEALRSQSPNDAFPPLRDLLGYPASELLDPPLFAEAIALLSRVAEGVGATAAVPPLARLAAKPQDAQALYDAGYELYEQRLFEIAASLFARANQLAPGQPGVVSELAACLEALLRYGEAAQTVDGSGLAEADPICAYLSGFHWLMTGTLERPRRRLAQLEGIEQGQIPFMREALRGMLVRADALGVAGISLDDRALTAWQAVVNGTLLLHESPHGHDDPMRGRYAYVSDGPGLAREGIERLVAFLDDSHQRPNQVVAVPDRSSRILAAALALRLDVDWVDWHSRVGADALVVAWSLDHVGDADCLQQLRQHLPAQRLFVHASCWTDPFPYSPDITTLLYQTVANAWTGGAMRVDPDTRKVVEAEPDLRDDETLAREVLGAEVRDPSVTSVETVLAVARALRDLPPELQPGFYRSSGRRLHQRAGGPVPSSRFR